MKRFESIIAIAFCVGCNQAPPEPEGRSLTSQAESTAIPRPATQVLNSLPSHPDCPSIRLEGRTLYEIDCLTRQHDFMLTGCAQAEDGRPYCSVAPAQDLVFGGSGPTLHPRQTH